jgi:hypothetical protein
MRRIILDTNAPRCYGGALFYKRKMGVMVFVNEILNLLHLFFITSIIAVLSVLTV